MSKWPRLSGKQMIKLLHREGYALVRIRGSHHHFKNAEGNTVTIPLHGNRPLAIGTLSGTVTEMMGLTQEKFIALVEKHL